MEVPSIGETAYSIAGAGRGVQVDDRGAARRLGVAVGDPDGYALVQGEDVAEVRREVLQGGQLVRAGIAEDSGEA